MTFNVRAPKEFGHGLSAGHYLNLLEEGEVERLAIIDGSDLVQCTGYLTIAGHRRWVTVTLRDGMSTDVGLRGIHHGDSLEGVALDQPVMTVRRQLAECGFPTDVSHELIVLTDQFLALRVRGDHISGVTWYDRELFDEIAFAEVIFDS